MKRKVAWMLTIVLGLSMLTGCGGSEAPAAEENSETVMEMQEEYAEYVTWE